MILSLATVLTVTSSAAAWDGSAVSDPFTTTGTEADPHVIKTAADLAYVAKAVNEGVTKFENEYIVLANDIDLGNNEWAPIGNSTDIYFAGTFDGKGYTIKNFKITDAPYAGLFGVAGCTVKNLTIDNATIDIESPKYCAAFVVAQTRSSSTTNIENCVVTKTCSIVTGTPTSATRVGAFAGAAGSKATINVRNCVNYANITYNAASNDDSACAGIVGFTRGGTIENCVNYGNITVTFTGTKRIFAGGIVGGSYNHNDDKSPEPTVVKNVINYGNVAGHFRVGGIIGRIAGVKNTPGQFTLINAFSLASSVKTELSTGKVGVIFGSIEQCELVLENVRAAAIGDLTVYGAAANNGKTSADAAIADGIVTLADNATVEALPEVATILIETGIKTNISIVEAAALGATKDNDAHTTVKYYVSGVIDEIVNTKYGNMYIKDADGNRLYIYGTYTADGVTRYDAMNPQPQVGDTVTVYGVVGKYNDNPQMKNVWVTKLEQVAPEVPPVNPDEPDEPIVEPETPVGEALAGFDFGANGDAAHADGSALTAENATWTIGNYTLTLTDMSKVYGPAFDAMGNSCIKLGTGSALGAFKFTVPEDVAQVVISIAAYKGNDCKVSINGVEYEVLPKSNNGEYMDIIIDTTTEKTIDFTTVKVGSACRAMINGIAFNAAPVVTPPDAPQTGDSLGTAIVIAACALAIGTAAAVVIARKKENA